MTSSQKSGEGSTDNSPASSSGESSSADNSPDSSSTGWINEKVIDVLLDDQRDILFKLEKANETMDTCLTLSGQRLESYIPEFKTHIKLLVDMKKDLESVHRRLQLIQTKVAKLYPKQYVDARSRVEMHEDEEE